MLSIVLPVLGLFLLIVSFMLKNVIENNCKKNISQLTNSIIAIGILTFVSSMVYMIGQKFVIISSSILLSFNLILGIVIIILFSLVSNEVNNCKNMNSYLINIGIAIGSILSAISFSFLFLSKKSLTFKINDLETPLPADYQLGLHLPKNQEGPKRK